MTHPDSGIPQLDLGGSGTRLHFSHANGYPPGVYQQLLVPMAEQFRVTASLHRPLWAESFAEMPNWQTLGHDLGRLLVEEEQAVIGMGHSMGAAALVMAAVRQPQRFKALVLVEPVMISRRSAHLMRLLRPIARRRLPFVQRALQRIDRWPSQQAVFDHFRPKRVFAGLSDEVLWNYVQHGTRENAAGEFELVFGKQWEAHCYLRIYSLWHLLPKLTMPVLAMRGAHSDVLSRSAWQRWQRKCPEHEFVEIAGAGHLLPLEQPHKVRELVLSWVS